MAAANIKTYSTEAFRQRYITQGQKINDMLKPGFGNFFITLVEDMIRLMKLPVPPARATTHSFIYLTQGEAVMSIGSSTYTIYKNECLFVPAGQVFSFNNVDENKGYLCNFSNDFIINKNNSTNASPFDFLQVWGNPVVKLDKDTSAHVHYLLTRIFNVYTANGIVQPDLLQAYFTAALYEISSMYKPLQQSLYPSTQMELANKFKQLIVKHIKQKHLVTAYAQMLHITPNHLNKVVKQVTGKSPTKWIDETLVLEAKVLLYQTSMPIGDVAHEIGLQDASYFSKLFKKYTGVTPLQFRQKIEKY